MVIETEYSLGDRINLCEDKGFVCVVVGVRQFLGRNCEYLIAWRDRYDFAEKWMTASEIEAYKKLEG